MLRITFNRLSTKVLGNLAQRVLAVLSGHLEGVLKDNPLVSVLTKTNDKYQNVVIKKTYSELGEEVRNKDLRRDRFFYNFRRLLISLSVFTGTAKNADAEALLRVFDEVGDITGLSYAAQNTVMGKLFQKLSTEERQAAITRLGLTEEYELLKSAQDDFETISGEQTNTNSSLRQIPSASESRQELKDALRNFFALVSAMHNEEAWKDLYYDLDELIKEANRSNRDNKDDKDKDNPSGK